MSEPFEEIVKELETKYRVSVDPAVVKKVTRVVRSELGELIEEKKYLSLKDVRAYFKWAYKKLWCWRKPLASVDDLIVQVAKKYGVEVLPRVREELNRVFASLTGDTLFAAAAYVVLTRGRKGNPEDPTVTVEDVELVCKEFLLVPKPHWLC